MLTKYYILREFLNILSEFIYLIHVIKGSCSLIILLLLNYRNVIQMCLTPSGLFCIFSVSADLQMTGGVLLANLSVKEFFVFSDPDGNLYHLTVDGNVVKDGARLSPPVSSISFVSFCLYFQFAL